jgi:hypothetical protein
MSRSREERQKFIAEAISRFAKRPPMPTYQKAVFWIIILGALFLVLDVVFFR